MRFAKYQGLGNDFLVVDLRDLRGPDAEAAQNPDVVRALCDRQFGVGGDGVLAVLPGDPGADARMRVLNSDGSEAEMCGNGIRCVAKELFDRGGIKKDRIAIDTGAGRLVCAITATGGVADTVTVEMGAPRLLRGEIPMTGPASERCIEQPLKIDEISASLREAARSGGAGSIAHTELSITAVSMGNPHAVAFVPGNLMKLATTMGPHVENHAWFPKRTNSEFARVISPTEIELVVWERGCGITLACGTGACATVVAAVVTGRAQEGTDVLVHLPGGDLTITVLPGYKNVLMKGPARHVFDGELDPRVVSPRPTS
ncbi:MAG TPA: diaminopimelate epimerase [Kofleriaceae bacterium]|nr:diaminopimelate epimerase [Kofleriaceae bacterium]